MKRIISLGCTIIICFNVCSAFVTYEIPVRKEKIIPIDISTDESEVLEYIDISEYEDVKILEYNMDKGKAVFQMQENDIVADLYDGEYTEGKVKIEKVKEEDIEVYEENLVFEPEELAKEVLEVGGDFKEADLQKNGEIIVKLKENAIGEEGYDKNKKIKSELIIEVDKNNRERTVYSDYYEIPEEAKVEVKDVDLQGDATIEYDNGRIRLLFTNGIPQNEESVKKDGYGYFWVDRAIDGSFRTRYPNSVYRSDREYFEGRGEYVVDDRLIIEREFEENWKDYVGFYLDGERYIYTLSEIPKDFFEDSIILNDNKMVFEGSWFNTDKLSIEITEDSVKYIPEGNLYSMGKLVAYSEGWGEEIPIKSHESNETFFNPISGKVETYVKHFKFFYGPKMKETFGGTFKYPYKAKLEYEHYKPTTVYKGTISYTYDDYEYVSGYLFNGWIKISYLDYENVNDYPPSAPYNVFYNNSTKILKWSASTDDYTGKDQISYEIEIDKGEGFYKVALTGAGENYLKYEDGEGEKFRVRAVDNKNQVSDWAYSGESEIEIMADINPQIVSSGDNVDINAYIKSISPIKEVRVYSSELGIEDNLIKKTETKPEATEISFNLLNYTGKEPWLIVDDMVYAKLDKTGDVKIKSYFSDAETEGKNMTIELPENIYLNPSGTIILPNQNYTGIPSEISYLNDYLWYFDSSCGLNFKNKITGIEEVFIRFENDTKAELVGKKEKITVTPYIKVNLFDYSDGSAKYEKIPLSTSLATKPIALTWDTKENMTEFKIYIDGEYIYTYTVDFVDLQNNIESFCSYSLGKSMDRMLKNSVGYQYHHKSKYYNWSNMYKAGNLDNMPWLGYKLKNKNESSIYDGYNHLSTTRDVNRLVFLDKEIGRNTIKSYLSKIKSTNLLINKKDNETVFASKIQEISSEFYKKGIKINPNVEDGEYDILITAEDELGNIGMTSVTLMVKNDIKPKITLEDIKLGRFFYEDNNINKKVIEELPITKYNSDTKGFISAGETLAIVIDEEFEVENITIDFIGDESITIFDKLTKQFLKVEKDYKFPLDIKKSEEGVFLYTIPYETEQTLESWRTLREKSDDYENIDKNLLFSRITKPYKLKVIIDNEEFYMDFDVFERWDTILNRNISKYVTNLDKRWRISL